MTKVNYNEQFKTPGIVFNRQGEVFDLTDILLVSKKGDVFILPRQHNGKFLDGHFAKCRPNKTNHCQISAVDTEGKRRFIYVHRLVSHAWLKRESYQREVMHKDDNPLNNSVENLKWCTQYENIQDMISKNRNSQMKNRISDEVMLQIWKMGKGGINMKARHIFELFPHISKNTLFPILNGSSERLNNYLKF
jgi:hypothetical protein